MASSKLKSMIAPRNHRRSPSDSRNYPPSKINHTSPSKSITTAPAPLLPPNHPHATQPLREESRLRDSNCRPSPKKPIDVYVDEQKGMGLHKKSKSSMSLKSLMGSDKDKIHVASSPNKQENKKPKKSKSSTSLSSLISRPKSSKGSKADNAKEPREKENVTPPSTGDIAPPIWAQFASQPFQGNPVSTKIPLNDVEVDDEVALYNPQEYSPSKQRNFGDHDHPTLSRKMQMKSRPKSAALFPAPSQTSFTETLSNLRKRSHDKGTARPLPEQQVALESRGESRKASRERNVSGRASTEQQRPVDQSNDAPLSKAKPGSKVMAAVAAFNGIAQHSTNSKQPMKDPNKRPDPNAINDAFEKLLDSRNIPQNVREKMRLLNTKIKADFVEKQTSTSGSISDADSLAFHFLRADGAQKPESGDRSKTDDGSAISEFDASPAVEDTETPRKPRPRSLTFTRGRSDSNSKKQRPVSHARTKSSDAAPSILSPSRSTQSFGFLNRTPKPASPEDCISYLQKVQQPQSVEVGRLQKLRQLLRNETVTWVSTFINKGGMREVIGLLYRTIEIEWREEHEDALLHETLLCLKALCTTSSALQQLAVVQSTLFPTLLGMLFDKEKRGPSEFATRGIVVSLLFSYLSTSPSDLMESRARILLSYLRDPSKPEDAQPLGFIATMYHPRPYRIWCNEIVSVTKEVFWIFLHQANIVPYPTESAMAATYTSKHFPGERPPVPAAPYIGGVEWDATNYLAAHLDLLNGLIASLKTREERRMLRQELKDSGFEKCMGNSLRTCTTKFYGAVHAGLTTWIGAAREDGWDVRYVKEGPNQDEVVRTPSPKKRKHEEPAPKLDIPRLDLGGTVGAKIAMNDDDGWL